MLISPAIEIPLLNGMVAIIDAEDLHLVQHYKWWNKPDKKTFYARGRLPGVQRQVYMHRLILPNVPAKHEIDHINRNGLDNRKSNLRAVTNSQNQANKKSQVNSSSQYKGVSRKGNSWQAEGRVNYKRTYLGCFKSEEEAAKAYDAWAREAHGECAFLNFPC